MEWFGLGLHDEGQELPTYEWGNEGDEESSQLDSEPLFIPTQWGGKGVEDLEVVRLLTSLSMEMFTAEEVVLEEGVVMAQVVSESVDLAYERLSPIDRYVALMDVADKATLVCSLHGNQKGVPYCWRCGFAQVECVDCGCFCATLPLAEQ